MYNLNHIYFIVSCFNKRKGSPVETEKQKEKGTKKKEGFFIQIILSRLKRYQNKTVVFNELMIPEFASLNTISDMHS
jgi:hypothetical protein